MLQCNKKNVYKNSQYTQCFIIINFIISVCDESCSLFFFVYKIILVYNKVAVPVVVLIIIIEWCVRKRENKRATVDIDDLYINGWSFVVDD